MSTETPEAEGITEDQAAERLLEKFKSRQEKPEEKQETPENDPPEDNSDESEESSESDNSESTSDDDVEEEIDFLGEKAKLRGKEAREFASHFAAKVKDLEANTTRKFQEAAEIRKTAAEQIELAAKVAKIAQDQGEMLGHRKVIEQRLRELSSVNIQQLRVNDPAALAAITAEIQHLQMADQKIVQRLHEAGRAYDEADLQIKAKRFEEAAKYAQTIKGWGAEMDEKLLDYVVNKVGAPANEVRSQMSGWLIKLIHQAYEGQKVSQSKPWEKKSPGSNQTLKPGTSGQSKGQTTAAVESAQKRFKKSGSLDDAAQLLLARSKLRKR